MLQTPEKKPDAIARSYQVLSLLKVCEYCADYIEDRLGDDHVRPAAASLSMVLALAHEIAGEVHDALEESQKAVAP